MWKRFFLVLLSLGLALLWTCDEASARASGGGRGIVRSAGIPLRFGFAVPGASVTVPPLVAPMAAGGATVALVAVPLPPAIPALRRPAVLRVVEFANPRPRLVALDRHAHLVSRGHMRVVEFANLPKG